MIHLFSLVLALFRPSKKTRENPVKLDAHNLPSGRNLRHSGSKRNSFTPHWQINITLKFFYPELGCFPPFCPVTATGSVQVPWVECARGWWSCASMNKIACLHVQPTVSRLWRRNRRRRSGKRPMVKATTKAKDSAVLAGTQWSLEFLCQGYTRVHTHARGQQHRPETFPEALVQEKRIRLILSAMNCRNVWSWLNFFNIDLFIFSISLCSYVEKKN